MMEFFAKEYTSDGFYCINSVKQLISDTCTGGGAVSLVILLALLLIGATIFVWWIITLIRVLTHKDGPNRVYRIVLHFVVGAVIALICFSVI